jgi:tetratricopeptide (TPR) repeat protein
MLSGCGSSKPPFPLELPDEARPAPPVEVSAPPESGSPRTLEEEPLPSEAGPQSVPNQPADGAVVPAEPPTLADTIDASTAPNVAAATRLVDAGRAQMAAGDDGAALEQLERAIAIDPANAYAYYYLAELHFSHHTYDQAIAFADRAANLSDTRAPEWASRAYTLQGNAFEAVGRFGDAHDAYAHALEAAPGNQAAQVGLARVGGAAAPPP